VFIAGLPFGGECLESLEISCGGVPNGIYTTR